MLLLLVFFGGFGFSHYLCGHEDDWGDYSIVLELRIPDTHKKATCTEFTSKPSNTGEHHAVAL